MTLRHLNVFVTVCKHNNFTHAAEELHIAQPAVSTTISEIEKYYNVALFQRVNKRIVLTDEGRKLLIKAKNVLSSFDEFDSLARQTSIETKLRLGSSPDIGKTVLPGLLNKIKNSLPELNVSVNINQTLEIEKKIIDGTLDFALVVGQITSPNIISLPFLKDRLIVLCGMDYHIPNETSINELVQYPLLLSERGSDLRNIIDGIFETNYLSVIPAVESVSNEALAAIAAQNLGIAILPYSLVKERIGVDLKEITISDISLELQCFFIYRKDEEYSSLHKTVKSVLFS